MNYPGVEHRTSEGWKSRYTSILYLVLYLKLNFMDQEIHQRTKILLLGKLEI